MSRRPALALASAAAAVALAACGGSSSTSRSGPATTTRTVTSTTSAPPTIIRTTATTTTTSGPRASAAGAGCRSFAISATRASAGLGHVGSVLVFRNVGPAACTVAGYPGATLVSPSGHAVAARRTLGGYLGGVTSLASVRLAPGQVASATLEGLDADQSTGGGPCPRYVRLLVTPPNTTATRQLRTPLAAVCRPEIHPVVRGATGRSR